MAPEAKFGNARPQSDIWSLGCLIIAMVTLEEPDETQLLCGKLPTIKGYNRQVKSLIKRMLQISADMRPTNEDILNIEYIKPFFVKASIAKLVETFGNPLQQY